MQCSTKDFRLPSSLHVCLFFLLSFLHEYLLRSPPKLLPMPPLCSHVRPLSTLLPHFWYSHQSISPSFLFEATNLICLALLLSRKEMIEKDFQDCIFFFFFCLACLELCLEKVSLVTSVIVSVEVALPTQKY